MANLANLFETDSSEKKAPVNSGRRVLIATYSDGHQLSPMQSSSGVDQFSFGPSFWQAHDDDEWKSADDSDNPSYRRHSLPAQDYHNVIKRRGTRKDMKKSGRLRQGSTSPARRPDNSHLSNEQRTAGNDQTLPKHLRYDSDINKIMFDEV